MNAYDHFKNSMKLKAPTLGHLYSLAYDSCNFYPLFPLIYTFSLLVIVSHNFNKNGMNGMQVAKSIVKSMVYTSYDLIKMVCASCEKPVKS